MKATTTLTDDQVVSINLYLRRHGLGCWECDINHWFAIEGTSIPGIDQSEPDEPIAVRVAVQCGYCGSRRAVLLPLATCHPHLNH